MDPESAVGRRRRPARRPQLLPLDALLMSDGQVGARACCALDCALGCCSVPGRQQRACC